MQRQIRLLRCAGWWLRAEPVASVDVTAADVVAELHQALNDRGIALRFAEMVVENGIMLRKYFLDVSQDEQRRRFEARISDPMKHWKLSPMDTESVRR
jgi:polyphosphate kinase 2 (PPK2 family)